MKWHQSHGIQLVRHDIFPEEFAGFLLTNPHVRETFMREHADLLEAEYWQSVQSDINAGRYQDIFPYSEAKRFLSFI